MKIIYKLILITFIILLIDKTYAQTCKIGSKDVCEGCYISHNKYKTMYSLTPKMVKKLKKRANKNHLTSIYVMGLRTKEYDLKSAILWFKKGSELNSPLCIFMLGKIYWDKKNIPMSIKYFEKTAEMGDFSSQLRTGLLYARYEFEKHPIKNWKDKAIFWLTLSVEQGLGKYSSDEMKQMHRSAKNILKKLETE